MFANRRDAGRQLAQHLERFRTAPRPLVLALPRGGVPVAFEVARALRAPLEVFVVRKLGVPGHEEVAMGAIASGGVRVLNEDLLRRLALPEAQLEAVTAREARELERREALYRAGRSLPSLEDRSVLLIDDGLATGASARAALQALRALNPATLVLAVPVGAAQTCAELAELADDVVCPVQPEPFYAVGQAYVNFGQTGDDEVLDLLRASREGQDA
ncbi:putative phosphoribosyltransferase [Deinobacterium chartae]|uniref:Putative phosphoribosyltransferase n=1 Tax=Deinobacterium chartae TaxID=521158 RepID=A0A841HYT7_9DEIO|nr:phosphoribosyltransferase family protein [Deinobacterium chartae]MBB6097380.1 putative phosphoribosyltransferase [Deinobacterium chartae]